MDQDELQKADFIRMPESLAGTNCSNCEYEDDGECTYHDVLKLGSHEIPLDLRGLKVNEHTCCVAWDAAGVRHVGRTAIGVKVSHEPAAGRASPRRTGNSAGSL